MAGSDNTPYYKPLAVACSVYASIGKKVVPGSLAALKHMFRYLQGAKKRYLVNKTDNTEGMVISSDSDWAGMHTLTGEVRY